MRQWVLGVFGLWSTSYSAQWQHVPLGLEGEAGMGAMAAPGIGYWASSTVLSPSSGTNSRIYCTTNEWVGFEVIVNSGAGVQCCGLDVLGSLGADLVFYRFNQGGSYRLRSARVNGSQTIETQFASIPAVQGYFIRLEPIADTVCVVPGWYLGRTLVARVTPNTMQVLDTVWGVGQIAFLDRDIGAVVSIRNDSSEVRLTTNGGEDWTSILFDTMHRFERPEWSADGTLWVVGAGGWVARTSDAGGTWTMHDVPGTPRLLCVAAQTSERAWVGDNNGVVYSTGDGGESWESWSSGDSLVSNLWAFEGVVYAETRFWNGFYLKRGRLYRKGIGVGVRERGVGGIHWYPVDGGIELKVEDGKQVQSFRLFEPSGREVHAGGSGYRIGMEHLANGPYILQLRTDGQVVSDRILWMSGR